MNSAQLFGEPGAREGPVAPGRAFGEAEDGGCFMIGNAGEEAQFDEFDDYRVFSREAFEGVVDEENGLGFGFGGEVDVFEIDSLEMAAPSEALFLPSFLDEDAPHGFGGSAEEMFSVFPVLVVADEAQPGFVNEGGGLEGLAWAFVVELVGGEASEFFVNKGEEFVGCLGIALLDGLQDLGDVGHGERIRGEGARAKPQRRQGSSRRARAKSLRTQRVFLGGFAASREVCLTASRESCLGALAEGADEEGFPPVVGNPFQDRLGLFKVLLRFFGVFELCVAVG